MPISCQGLPLGLCPDNRCDTTVRNTVYDLFLCPSYESARFKTEYSGCTASTIVEAAASASTNAAAYATATADECGRKSKQ
jgi:hypothetical protein